MLSLHLTRLVYQYEGAPLAKNEEALGPGPEHS